MPPPTVAPTPEPTPLPVYAMVHEGGMCKRGTSLDVTDVEECALMCSSTPGCVYLSYSAELGICKLNEDCDMNDHMNAYNVYMIDATPSPTAAPTPMPPPTVAPTPAPTSPVVYGKVHEGGMCKGGSWIDGEVSVEQCAIFCRMSGDRNYFSHDGSTCKLTAGCDINDNYNDFDIYQLDATSVPTAAPTDAPTPQPTTAPDYSSYQVGRCKGASLGATTTTATDFECALQCDADTDCNFFSWRSTTLECKLSANCNRVNQWDTTWNVYQMNA